jgi:hypothetical protein
MPMSFQCLISSRMGYKSFPNFGLKNLRWFSSHATRQEIWKKCLKSNSNITMYLFKVVVDIIITSIALSPIWVEPYFKILHFIFIIL